MVGLETSKPAFHVGVQVGTLRWQQHDFGIGVLFDELAHGDEAGVSIHDEVTGVFQEPIFTIRQVPADLLHPRGIRTRRDPVNVDATGFQMHHSENVEGHQSSARPDFDSREVGGKDGVPVSLQKC